MCSPRMFIDVQRWIAPVRDRIRRVTHVHEQQSVRVAAAGHIDAQLQQERVFSYRREDATRIRFDVQFAKAPFEHVAILGRCAGISDESDEVINEQERQGKDPHTPYTG